MLQSTLRRATLATVLCGVFVIAAPSGHSSFQGGDAKDLMQQGLDFLRRGEDEKALATFRTVLGANPSNEDAWRIWREVDNAVFLRMLAKGGEYESIARAILAKATPSFQAAKKDPAAIEALVNDALGDDFAKRQAAVASLTGMYGAYTIQGLVGPLSDAGNDERRVRAMELAFRLGGAAVPPLVALLESPDATLRRSAAVTLGRGKDIRAAARLAVLAESDSDSVVKADARRAAMACGWAGLEGSASDYLVGESMAYLRRNLEFVRPADMNDVVWDFVDGKLLDAAVPRGLFGSEMARRAALSAVAVRHDNAKALALVALANAEAGYLATGLSEDEGKAMAEKLAGIREELRLTGPAAMALGTSMALDAGDARVTIALLHEIAETTASGLAMPNVVGAAMGAANREVRLAASVVACAIDPNQANHPDVMKRLADAVGEKVQRVVLVVDENAERRAALVSGFEKARWFAAPCDTAVSAIARVRRFSGTDLIVLSASLKDMVAEQVIDELRADDRTKGVPIVVVTDATGVEGAKTRFGANAKNVVSQFDAAAMDAAIEGQPMNPERARAEHLAAAAARAIAHCPTMPEMAKGDALAALAEAAQSRADLVRIPAMRALGRFGDAAQQGALAAVVSDANASVTAKAAACDALAAMGTRCLTLGPEAMKAADEALGHADASVRAAAAGALGSAPNCDAAMRAKILAAKAVPFSASGAAKAAEAAPAGSGSSN